MTLSALIRKRDNGKIATAIPAIPATQPKGEAATVARIATVAVANPNEEKTAPPAKACPGDTATASRQWKIHYPDRAPTVAACSPAMTRAEALSVWHGAVVEPFTPAIQRPPSPLTVEDERVIFAWLALIEETDPATIAEVLDQCRNDAEARGYYLGQGHMVH